MFKKFTAVIATFLLSTLSLVVAPSASANEVCVGIECSVTFSYTGAPQIWQVPANASNLRFDVQGASGGRDGGLGGRVTGSLIGTFTQLEIYVGGAGATGAGAAGGFNGGGTAGGNRTNEGSGGGASDIRVGGGLNSRIVVAGGGGGTGGFAGATGGHGGGLIAKNGDSGQGAGGGGGTQTQGGAAGSSNGGSAQSTGGSFGQGGSGGISWNAGGGGGGGGWFGGGGGGADDDGCCSDGGGGGGGSSYASANQTSSVSHETGVRRGDGIVIISYQIPAEFLGFTAEQITATDAKFTLRYNVALTGVEISDFTLTGLGCRIAQVQSIVTNIEIDVIGCQENPTLNIPVGVFSSGQPEPTQELSATITLDQTAPIPRFDQSVSSNPDLTLTITTDENLSQIDQGLFEVVGCESFEASMTPVVQVRLLNCAEGVANINLLSGALLDSYGNKSAAKSHAVTFDFTAPEISWSNPVVEVGETFSVSSQLLSSENFELDQNAISISGNSATCVHTLGNNYELQISGCEAGQVTVELAALSVVDQAGNRAPEAPLSFTATLAIPTSAPEQPTQVNDDPVVVTPPTQEENPAVDPPQQQTPEATPTPIFDEPADPILEEQPEVIYEPEVPTDGVANDVAPQLPINQIPAEQEIPVEFQIESEPTPTPESESETRTIEEPDLEFEVGAVESVAFETTEQPRSQNAYLLAGLIVLALLALGGAGAYLMQLRENNRSRSI